MSRDTSLIIRGGANYACEQIKSELSDFLSNYYHLPKDEFDMAVIGLKIDSDHEDACCVTIELLGEKTAKIRKAIEKSFIRKARHMVSKGAKPDYLRLAKIPKNFKGAVSVPGLEEAFKSDMENDT